MSNVKLKILRVLGGHRPQDKGVILSASEESACAQPFALSLLPPQGGENCGGAPLKGGIGCKAAHFVMRL